MLKLSETLYYDPKTCATYRYCPATGELGGFPRIDVEQASGALGGGLVFNGAAAEKLLLWLMTQVDG